MTHLEIILSGLALAFCWVKILQAPLRLPVLNFKPLNCLTCLTGWISFGLAIANNYSVTALLFLAVGVFVGAMFEALTMKYL